MSEISEFHTLKGYSMMEDSHITTAMEDYLEMIMRLREKNLVVRINTLAGKLNVKPSSASKMVQNLRDNGMVEFERYGVITPTKQGYELGEYLLLRHDVLNRFLMFINHSSDELKQVERIEHFFDKRTILNIAAFLKTQIA